MGRPMVVGAWGSFDGDTAIEYAPGNEGAVEIMIGGPTGFSLFATDSGLARLATVIEAALADERRLSYLDDRVRDVRTD
ncbi:MAG TPA: hypothetical protein VGD84_16105 [Pseudonocardiaceae bacterium]